MDPLTAIGLASNILSFIDFGVKLTAAAYEVYGSADGATIVGWSCVDKNLVIWLAFLANA